MSISRDRIAFCRASLNVRPIAITSPTDFIHPNLAELYRRKVAELRTSLEHPECRDGAITILRSLIDHVVVRPVDEGFEVQFVGEIANMISVPHGKGAMKIDQSIIAVKRVAWSLKKR